MIDHVCLSVSDYKKSKNFYQKALAPLGSTVVMEFDQHACGFGQDGKPTFWIGSGPPSFWQAQHKAGTAPVHFAFVAHDRAQVDAFYKEAMAAGGKDNGKPGLRAEYHPNYYGAFVIDPDGNNVEAVCHR